MTPAIAAPVVGSAAVGHEVASAARRLLAGQSRPGWSRTDPELVAEVADLVALRAQVDGLLLDAVGEVDSRGLAGAGLLLDPGLAALGAPDRTGRGRAAGPHRHRATHRPAGCRAGVVIRDRVAGPGRGDRHRHW